MANVNVFTAVQNAMDNHDDFGPRGPFWISKYVGAFIFSNSGGDIQAAKTSDGGATYNTSQTELDGTPGTLAAEFDLTIPGGSGNRINVVWGDDIDDDFTFAQFDISTGLFSGRVNLTTTSSGNPSRAWIARTRAGGYLAGMYQETAATGLAWKSADGVIWSAIATPHEAGGADFCLGISVNTGDAADGGILYLDVSANELTIKMYDDSLNTWTESGSMPLTKTDNSRTFEATTRLSDGQVLLAVVNATDSATGDINVYRINANSIAAPTITALTDVLTDSAETGSVGIFIDQTNDDIYVAYGRGSNYAANLQAFYKKSTDGGATWSVETAYSEGTGAQWRVTGGGSMGASGGVFLPAFHNQALDDLIVNVVNAVLINGPLTPGGTLPYLAAAFDLPPYMRAWHYDTVTGAFGTVMEPAVDPGSAGRGIRFHPDRDYIAVAHTLTPFATIYNFDKTLGLFGAKLANPGTLPPGEVFKVDWHPSGEYIALAHRLGSFFSVYAFDPDAGAWGARSADPADLPSQLGLFVHWHPSGNWLMQAGFSSPHLRIYPFNPVTGVIGAKLADPAVLPGSNAGSARWSADGNWIVAVWGDTIAPELGVWAFDQSGGGAWGAKASGPADVATNDQHNTAVFTADLTRILVGQNINLGGPRAYAYEFDASGGGTVGARRAAASPEPADNVNEIVLDRNERFAAVGHLSASGVGSVGLHIWNWDGSDYGVVLADPPDVPISAGVGVNVFGVDWSELPAPTPPNGHPTPLGGGPQPYQSTEREALRVLATARGFGAPSGGESQSLEITLLELLDTIRGYPTAPTYPIDADRLFDLIFAALEVPRPRYVTRNGMLAVIEANLPPI